MRGSPLTCIQVYISPLQMPSRLNILFSLSNLVDEGALLPNFFPRLYCCCCSPSHSPPQLSRFLRHFWEAMFPLDCYFHSQLKFLTSSTSVLCCACLPACLIFGSFASSILVLLLFLYVSHGQYTCTYTHGQYSLSLLTQTLPLSTQFLRSNKVANKSF